jgi:hypothetical protein
MTHIAFTRHPGARGYVWLKESFAMFRRARVAWILLLMAYYAMLVVVDFVPFVGGLAAPLLKPVFAVGFLAAAWTQERGGVPAIRQLFQGFRSNVVALCLLGVFFVVGMTIAIGSTAVVDGGKLFDLIANPAPQDLDQDAVARRLAETLSDTRVQIGMLVAALCAIPTLLALWWAPALVVFQDAGVITALVSSLRAAVANWRALVRYVVLVFFFGGIVPTLAGTLIALIVPSSAGRAIALGLMLPYELCFVATLHIADYVSYRSIFHSDETLGRL